MTRLLHSSLRPDRMPGYRLDKRARAWRTLGRMAAAACVALLPVEMRDTLPYLSGLKPLIRARLFG